MNREIKFRVWDNVNYMSTSFTLKDLQHRTVQFTGECIVMQYTGVKDRLGKEAYEGDILKIRAGKKQRGKDRPFQHQPIVFRKGMFTIEKNESVVMDFAAISVGEVIGNIYENPELLEQPGT